MALGLGVVGTMMHMGIHTHAEQIFTVTMLLIFIVGFAMSAGPLIWTLCSEVQPLGPRLRHRLLHFHQLGRQWSWSDLPS